jgi:hypothetical protein
VFRFFVGHPGLDPIHVGPIVDYLHHQKFEGREGVSPAGTLVRLPPPRPDYSIKGRSVASVLRQVADWHHELGAAPTGGRTWPTTGIRGYRDVEGGEPGGVRVWTVTELRSARDLVLEGRMLRHCVAAYADRCARRRTSVWSVQVETAVGRRRVLTVEVDLAARAVRQVRGRANRSATPEERGIVEAWAAAERLTVGDVWRP